MIYLHNPQYTKRVLCRERVPPIRRLGRQQDGGEQQVNDTRTSEHDDVSEDYRHELDMQTSSPL